MGKTLRFSVSMDEELLGKFDDLTKRKEYENRSESLRDIIRDALVKEEWKQNEEIVGTITLVYDHHKRGVMQQLTSIQHELLELVLSNLHIHLDHHNCLEVIVVRGKAKKVQKLTNSLLRLKGVKHGGLHASTTGRLLC
jgi:CopG family transcriptional regulator, nickel-responsive regulator